MTTKRTLELPEGDVVAGIDTHEDTHTIALLDRVGAPVATATYRADPDGYRRAADFITSHGTCAAVGVEGTNSYGAGLRKHLQSRGLLVLEALRPKRQVRRMDGKSDPIDAAEAARSVLAGRGPSVPKDGNGHAEALRFLDAARAQLVRAMTALSNSAGDMLVTAPEAFRSRWGRGRAADALKRISSTTARGDGIVEEALMAALKAMARQHRELDRQARQLERRMREILDEHAPASLTIYGAGTITAARLVAAAGDNPDRIRDEAAFAKLCGACPIPASSGRTNRHRLNRGGNRNANSALHRIALVRMSHPHPRTRDYIARKRAQGMGTKEIMRCIKRAICREAYRAICHPERVQPPPDGGEPRSLRESKGILQKHAAHALGVSQSRISEIERDANKRPELAERYQQWLQNHPQPATHATCTK